MRSRDACSSARFDKYSLGPPLEHGVVPNGVHGRRVRFSYTRRYLTLTYYNRRFGRLGWFSTAYTFCK